MSRWRAASLIAVHLLMIGHILQWWAQGRTISPVEPSEAMYTLNRGYLNAGFIFFALAILSTLVLGRFFCGWGCHLVAYQDLCTWLLRKIGIKPKPFRSRILVLVPLALAIYMFVWPTAYRWFAGSPVPAITNHLTTTAFWTTFPGVGVALLTFAVCGFFIVYILGAKGFCTYACPYGGFFGLADQVAVGRIRVTDDCEHCGHCTAVCSSNVRVHEEVARFGMVVDPGCMKCMDCISVCPNDALYFGLSLPPILNRKPAMDDRKFQISNLKSEISEITSSIAQSPNRQITKSPNRKYDFSLTEELLMIVTGLFSLFAFRGLYGQIPLLLAMAMAVITAFLAVKFLHLLRSANVKLQNFQLKIGGRMTRTGWVFAAAALTIFAFAAHSSAVQYRTSREAVAKALMGAGRFAEARTELSAILESQGESAAVLAQLGIAELQTGETEPGLKHLRRALELDSALSETRYNLAVALLSLGRVPEATALLERLVADEPKMAETRYNLAVAVFMSGRPADALPHAREALRLAPDDVQARDFLAVILEELSQVPGTSKSEP